MKILKKRMLKKKIQKLQLVDPAEASSSTQCCYLAIKMKRITTEVCKYWITLTPVYIYLSFLKVDYMHCVIHIISCLKPDSALHVPLRFFFFLPKYDRGYFSSCYLSLTAPSCTANLHVITFLAPPQYHRPQGQEGIPLLLLGCSIWP